MRILHIIKNFDFGGAENHLCVLANSLDAIGNEIYLIGGQGTQQSRLSSSIKFIPLQLRSLLFLYNILWIVYYVLHYKIQIIHAHQRYPIHLASIVGKITRTPLVVTVHGRSQYDLRSRFSRKYADKIIFVSQFVMENSIRFPEIQKKVVYIPNGVLISTIKSVKKICQVSYVSRMDSKHCAVVLMIIHHILPRLLMDYPLLTFNIVGGGHQLEVVKEEAQRFNQAFNKEVCLVSGFQSNVMESICPSVLVLGVGRVALEALGSGIPVLSVNRKRLGTVINTENFPFYKANNFVAVGHNPPDAETLLAQIQLFLTNQLYFQTEANELQSYVDEEFNHLKIASRINELYKELV